MPSAFTHAFAALALGKVSTGEKRPIRFWVLSALCAVLPDVDVIIGFAFGLRGSMFDHRGITHSLLFALLLVLLVVRLAFKETPAFSKKWWRLFVYFFIITASHGLLDALTDGGSGVAFFAPFDGTRYFFPWRPIEVSPIGLRFFSNRGLVVLASELVWVWIPAILLVAVAWLYRRLRASMK
ncbi:MAG: inner membrane protein [Acidobacteriota bacterium]|jgi:inner membrane protein|nr:inner membrane protein [Acidobacteriota bacterium]